MIVFGFSRAKSNLNFGSWIIRKVQGTSYSHTYVKWHDQMTDKWVIYQATGKGGVGYVTEENFARHSIIIKEFACANDPFEFSNAMKYCQNNSGQDYGFFQLVGILYAKTVKWIGGRVDNPFPQGQVCCETVAVLLMDHFGVQMDHADMDVIDVKYVHDKLESAVDNKLQGGRWSVFFQGVP